VIDSHCHLADEAFEGDLPDVVERARQAGLHHALCVLAAGSAAEARRADRVAVLWPEVRFAAGVHPHEAGRFAEQPARVDEVVRAALAGRAGVRALGEIGLDYHYDVAPRPVQQVVFARQVALACELDLPVVIHTREATADTFAILREAGGDRVRGVFHCFSGDADMARAALEIGFYVSFAGMVTFPRAENVQEAARVVPLDRLLVETDSPYLSPVPHRGQRNEPARVVHVADTLARLRGEPAGTIAAGVVAAYVALFRP